MSYTDEFKYLGSLLEKRMDDEVDVGSLKKLFMAASDLAPSSNCDRVQPGQVRISDLEVSQCGR